MAIGDDLDDDNNVNNGGRDAHATDADQELRREADDFMYRLAEIVLFAAEVPAAQEAPMPGGSASGSSP